ncbi:MAG: hypothetical protein ACI8Q1_000708 [Parvicella sp.]|jgi:hypothetical protein
MILISISLLLIYTSFFFLVLQKLVNSEFQYLLYFSIILFPVYTVFLSIVYAGLQQELIITILQYSKEVLFFTGFGILILGRQKGVSAKWKLGKLDLLQMLFLGFALIYAVLPIGEATFVSKAIYLKNIVLIGLFYFFGRQVELDFSQWNRVFRMVFVLAIVASVLVVSEKVFGIHFHSLIGYRQYNFDIKDLDLLGIYGIGYTFEAQGGQPRYGSFFSNPLELSASMLIVVSAALFYLLSAKFKQNRAYYLFVLACGSICLLFAYSRATFVAVFIMLVFIAFLLRYYKLLLIVFGSGLLLVVYVLFLASEETLYFVLDTLTFQNSSSVTHLIEWAQAVDSIVQNPFGIGLGTSGNTSGVEDDLRVGGENQYLIYGVQLGFFGMLLYIGILSTSIMNAWRAFRAARSRQEGLVPFVAASVKFGLLLPLFTANVEAYLFISLISWWLVGQVETQYQQLKNIGRSNRKNSFPVIDL